ncbi:hypothetical protein SCLCIDRAFT_1223958 [Scleroderma citrinum Foug A]|uniref:Uncharacterized protein n=1 Tax=Scleroderma citrinum Foug A TaxID=1036808 RepID=A0A0C2ZHD2_9AGAM|nr:hypothetical protein SCLCIDRAFT_1223958 [Scleroderma citrinum Foug A]
MWTAVALQRVFFIGVIIPFPSSAAVSLYLRTAAPSYGHNWVERARVAVRSGVGV